MKIFSILSVVLFTLFTSDASAQFRIRIGNDGGYRSGSYDGYWNPYHTPQDFRYRMGEIVFENHTRGDADIYHVDRHGRWIWTASLDRGEKTKLSSPVGDVWVMRGANRSITQRVVARPGKQEVHLRYADRYEGDRYGPRRDQRFDVIFRNRMERPVTLYSLQPWGEWVWAGAIPAYGGEIEVRAFDNQEFRVLDRRGNVISRYKADSDDRRVTIKER